MRMPSQNESYSDEREIKLKLQDIEALRTKIYESLDTAYKVGKRVA